MNPIIEEKLEELEFVSWDRLYQWEQGLVVYGWIEREEDSYKDFLVIEFEKQTGIVVRWDTSSAQFHDIIAQVLDTEAIECERVEDFFNLENMIELGEKE